MVHDGITAKHGRRKRDFTVKDAEAPSFSGRKGALAIGCRMDGVRAGLDWGAAKLELRGLPADERCLSLTS
jgi:hypothetical protein